MHDPRSTHISVIVLFIVAAIALVPHISAQCAAHPQGKTALIFNNQSSYELTFYIDDDNQGITLPAKHASGALDVDDGEHLLRAAAIIDSQELWVWAINDVPAGQVCTWTVEDPPMLSAFRNVRF
jgi:hypothetical protein